MNIFKAFGLKKEHRVEPDDMPKRTATGGQFGGDWIDRRRMGRKPADLKAVPLYRPMHMEGLSEEELNQLISEGRSTEFPYKNLPSEMENSFNKTLSKIFGLQKKKDKPIPNPSGKNVGALMNSEDKKERQRAHQILGNKRKKLMGLGGSSTKKLQLLHLDNEFKHGGEFTQFDETTAREARKATAAAKTPKTPDSPNVPAKKLNIQGGELKMPSRLNPGKK